MKTGGVRRFGSGMALVAATSLVLAGCSGGAPPDNGEPSASPLVSSGNPGGASASGSASGNSSSATSASATPTPVPASAKGPAKNWPVPKMPAEAKKKTAEGAAAFTEYYFELIEYTTVTNDSKPMENVTERGCGLCVAGIIVPAKKNTKGGGWNAGGAYEVDISSARLLEGSEALTAFRFNQSKQYTYNSGGDVNSVQEATIEPVIGSMSLTWKHGWRTTSIDVATS